MNFEHYLDQKLKNEEFLTVYYKHLTMVRLKLSEKEVNDMKTLDFYRCTLRGALKELDRLIRLGQVLKDSSSKKTSIKEFDKLLGILNRAHKELDREAIKKGDPNEEVSR